MSVIIFTINKILCVLWKKSIFASISFKYLKYFNQKSVTTRINKLNQLFISKGTTNFSMVFLKELLKTHLYSLIL